MIRFQFAVSPKGGTGFAPARARRGAFAWSLAGFGAVLCCFSAVPADAKPQSGASRRVATTPVSSSALGPDDVISVTVLRHPELSSESVTIPQSGQISVPEAGAVRVVGQTPAQAARTIARALSQTLIDPQVTVALKQARQRLVFVQGAVAKPGPYDIKAGWRISEAFAAAGGLSGRVDETSGSLTHKGAGGRPIPIDLKAVISNAASPKNVLLREGDTLAFAALETKIVTISGDVQKPGPYPLRQAPRVLNALSLAGELKGRSDETSATLTRGGRLSTINIQAIKDDPASSANLSLKAGDVLMFTAHDAKIVTVGGDVRTTGIYPLRQAKNLLAALTLAGGPKEDTARTRVTLFRDGKESPLDLAQAEVQNTPEFNVSLKNGDFLLVKSVPLLQVAVTGPFIRNAGNFQLAPDAGVAQAIAQANGTTVPFDQLVTTIVRGAQIIPVDLAQAALDPRANIPLKSGDAVFVNEPAIIRVQVAGAVKNQGKLRVAPKTTLLDVLNGGAGGLSIPAEEARITVVRALAKGTQTGASALYAPAPPDSGGGPAANGSATPQAGSEARDDRQVIRVDATALLGRTDLGQNVTLQDGDQVSVTQIRNPTVIVSGQVAKTGPYQVSEDEGISQLLARAGGATPNASLSSVILKRGGQSRVVDVYDEVHSGGKPTVNLQDGDTVIVPENPFQVRVINAVQKPGFYAIPERGMLTVTDAINLAGGPRDRAAPKQVGVLRPDPRAQNGVQRIVVDLDKFGKGDLSQNVVLRPGDIVYVPEAKAPRAGLLASLGQVIGTFTGLRYLTGQ